MKHLPARYQIPLCPVSIQTSVPLRLQITALDFTPDGKTLAVGSEDGVVALWDVAAARRLGAAQQHAGAVWALAASRGDGSLLASGAVSICLNAVRCTRADCPALGWAVCNFWRLHHGSQQHLVCNNTTTCTPCNGRLQLN